MGAKPFSAKAGPTAVLRPCPMAVLSRPGPMTVLSRPWPFFTKAEAPNGRFVKARSNGRFIKAFAVLSRQKQPSGQTSRFEPRIASSIVSRAINLSAAGPSHFIKAMSNVLSKPWPFYQSRSSQAAKHPDLSRGLQHFSPRNHFISIRAKPPKASPMVVLSRPSPMAVLSRPRPFYQGRSSLVARRPDFGRGLQIPAQSIYQRPGQAIFSKSRPNSSFIKARSNGSVIKAKAEAAKWLDRHPDFGRGLQIPYYPAQSVYQRPGQAIFSKSRSNGRFINARPNGRFIKAEATEWPDLQISATNCNFGIIPHNQFSGRAKLFSAKAGPMAVLSTRGPMAVFSKQKQPDGQTSRFQRQIAILVLSIPHNQFISGRAKLFSAKAGPMAVLSTRGPMAVLPKQKQPDGQTSRFQQQVAFSLVSRTISLSAATLSKSKPNTRFIKAMSKGRFVKALAVLSRQKQPSCQTSRFEPRIASSILARAISLSASGPSRSKRAQ